MNDEPQVPSLLVTIADFIAELSRRIPLDRAAAWDPVGLQLGDARSQCRSVAVCHEVTDSVVTAAENANVDLLISYHPLLFRPTTRITASSSASGRAYQMIRADIGLLVVHTAHDVASGGAADALAVALGLSTITAFGPMWPADQTKVVTFVPEADVDRVVAAMSDAGAGSIGTYSGCAFETSGAGRFHAPELAAPVVGEAGSLNLVDERRIEMIAPRSKVDRVVAALVTAHPYEEPPYDVYSVEANAGFLGRVGVLERPSRLADFATAAHAELGGVVRVAGDPNSEVQRVACIPGSGGSFLSAVDADVVVTGDVSHHQAQGALERGIAVVDPGHAATERPGIERLYAAVSALNPAAIDLTADPSPWRQL